MGLYEQMTLRSSARYGKKPLARVAFIGGRGVISKYSGIEAYYEEVGKRLAEMGYDLTVYCRTYFTPDVGAHNGMRLVRLPTIRSKHLETVVHTLLSTVHVMFRRCDIVHYHALGPALFCFLPRLVGKKTIVTVQGLDWQRKKWGRWASLTLQLGEIASARLPNSTMVVSRNLQDYYCLQYGAATRYVPNGAVLRERSRVVKIIEWGLMPDNYILFLGRFSPEKNCHLLIEAYEKLETPLKLVLAGGSSQLEMQFQLTEVRNELAELESGIAIMDDDVVHQVRVIRSLYVENRSVICNHLGSSDRKVEAIPHSSAVCVLRLKDEGQSVGSSLPHSSTFDDVVTGFMLNLDSSEYPDSGVSLLKLQSE
jgi:glycosyltransferase involved in cell wall biosynthesis